jgi:hypothetical protein
MAARVIPDNKSGYFTAMESEDESEFEDEIQIPLNSKSNEFQRYKKELMGLNKSIDWDGYCESYRLDDILVIKNFVERIKEYSLNDALDEKHISYFTTLIHTKKELYLLDRVSLAQYNNYTNLSVNNLIEIINGHHRIEALKRFFKETRLSELSNYKVTLRLDIYHLDNPNSEKTLDLFRGFNAVRPQKTDWPAKTLTNKIISKLNDIYSNRNFTLIKDNDQWTKKPSIHMKEFIKVTEARLEYQLKTVKNITEQNVDSVNINPIIQRFINYNETLKKETLEWLNDIKQRASIDNSKVITQAVYERAKKAKCFLGFVKLEHLVSHCVSL